MISELNLYHDTICVATGQKNQNLAFNQIGKQYTHISPIKLSANATSGLPVSYHVINGPANIIDDDLYFTGSSGTITIAAIQDGDDFWYPVKIERSFEVVNLQQLEPQLTCKLTTDYPIEMPQLFPYLLLANATIQESEQLSI